MWQNMPLCQDCRVKQELQKLTISDDLKIRLEKLILNSDASSEEEDKMYEIQEEASRESDFDCCDGIGPSICQNKKNDIPRKRINNKSYRQYSESGIQGEYLLKLKDIIIQKEKNKAFNKENYYNINKNYERFCKKKEPTIQDLQREVIIIKEQLRNYDRKTLSRQDF